MTDEQIQISKDSELMAQVISLIASHAVENDMSPDEAIKTVAVNMLGLLKIATFENWEKKTLPSVISTSDDCVSRQATLDAIIKELCIKDESYLLQSEKAIYNVVKNMPPVTPTHSTCKDCKHWKDSDGVYRRLVGAESKCPINIKEVYEGNFYCKDFEKAR